MASRLSAQPQVESVTGIARRAIPSDLASDPKIDHVQADIRSMQTEEALNEADTLVHCAFQCFGTDPAKLRQVNVDGSIGLISKAIESGIDHIVYISSAAAYGSHADNPLPIDESCPLRPNPGSWYSLHNAEVEWWLDQLEARKTDLTVLRVRPMIVLGPKVDAGALAIRRYYRRVVPCFSGDRQLFQFITADDATEAITRALLQRTRGALNVVGDGWLTAAELAHITGGRLLTMPQSFKRAVPMLQRLGITPVGRERVVLSEHPLALSNRRMREELELAPISSLQALQLFLEL